MNISISNVTLTQKYKTSRENAWLSTASCHGYINIQTTHTHTHTHFQSHLMTAPQEICWQLCRKKTITRQAVNFSFSYNFCNSIMQVIGYNLYVKKLIILISTNLGGKFRQKFFTNFLGCISDQHTKNDFHNKPTNKNAMLFMDAATLYNSIHLMLLTVKKNIY